MEINFIPKTYTFQQLFIHNSNAIDPQPGYSGNTPGCPMYENHMDALQFALSKDWEITNQSCLDIHRILTRDIPFFESQNASGLYRKCDVYIGGEKCPSSFLIDELMQTWFVITSDLIKAKVDPLIAAWVSHHIFENIHPFIDGNGRTGRLILNKVLTQMGHEPIIVQYANRYEYYDSINKFKNLHFKNNKFIDLDIYMES